MMSLKRALSLSLILSLLSLIVPVIWLKIGPKGYEHYGPTVPDIYILGATVLGKDRSVDVIYMPIIFQLVFISCFIITTLLSLVKHKDEPFCRNCTWFNAVLLLLFPVWICFFVTIVIHNSDGAASDLSIYPHAGAVIYLLLLILHIHILRATKGIRTGTANR